MTGSAESDARRALGRLKRAIEKAERELDAVGDALRHAEASDFPAAEFSNAADLLAGVTSFVDEQEQRLADKLLHTGGLEPGRVRRGG